MFYELFSPLATDHIVFNLIRYITFRSIAAFVTAFFIGVITAPWFIKKLRKLKFGQEVRDDGPESHKVKQGTPTMGGVFIIIAALLSSLLWARWNFYVFVVALSVLLFGLVGFVDDFLKVKQKNSKGVSAKLKLLLQLISSGIIVTLLLINPSRNREVSSYELVIKDIHNNEIKNMPISETAKGFMLWNGLDNDEVGVPAGVYTLEIREQDEAGNTANEMIATMNWKVGHDSIGIELYDVDHTGSQELDSDEEMYRAWTISYYYKFSSTDVVQETGIVQLPKTPDLLLSFYIPYYSKPLFEWPVLLGILFFLVTLISFSNATNLSDGLDGLASGMSIILYIPFGIIAYVMGNAVASSYLLFPYINGVGEIAIVITSMIGGLVAFLWYNVHPAEVFMGDTGSLAVGGVIATCAIILKQELLLIVAGAMFVVEALSVVLQVFSYKRFKKRIFKMAPIHHHFELSGWKETQVVVRFWILSALFALLALSALKIR